MNFVDVIAPLIQELGPKYGIMVNSPVIAQAILESASGTSELAVNCNNFFGLKYRKGRCPTALDDPYVKIGSEQNPDGSYVSSPMLWFKFPNIKAGVTGYYDFINIPNYANLKGVTDPYTYLVNLKADDYATSNEYVSRVMAVIDKYDLTKYDKKGDVKMVDGADSSLVTYVNWTTKYSKTSAKKIGITPHHMAGVMSAKQCADYHKSCNKACSATYYIGNDGDIAQGVHEKDRAWTSGSSSNDSTHVTIEVSNCSGAPDWKISDKAYASLVKLCADICKRNGIPQLIYTGDKNGSLTEHKMFQSTACPGPYLHNIIASGKLSQDVNALLRNQPVNPVTPDGKFMYDGLDFSPVFNPTYYSSKYPDLAKNGCTTPALLFTHFTQMGLPVEKRQAHQDFDVKKYMAVETDLAEFLGNDPMAYAKHYIMFGKQEIAEGKRAPFM